MRTNRTGKRINQTNFVKKLREAIDDSGKSQADLAVRLGYDNPNVISMFKSGTTRVPLTKVPAIARWLGLDATALVREWFEAYEPDALPVIEAHFGKASPGASSSSDAS
jgi:transcriptional regulator with XRE-family HTH domain